MTKIYALRHGETPMNRNRRIIGGRNNATNLTDYGQRQARAVGPALKQLGIMPGAIYATNAVRTQQTLSLAMEAYDFDLNPTITDALAEMSQGPFEGRSRSKVYTPRTVSRARSRRLDFKLPGAESMNKVADRVLGEFDEIAERHPDETILIVMHGLAITCAFGRELGWGHERIRKSVGNATLSAMEVTSGSRDVLFVGRTIIGPLTGSEKLDSVY